MEAISEAGVATVEASGKPCGMPWISPYLTVKDPSAALAFYESAFGFSKRFTMPGGDGSIRHAEMGWQEGVIMFGPEGAYGSTTKAPASGGFASPVTLYVYCEDVDALFERAVAAGAVVHFAPMDTFWGDRLCKLADPDGHVWNFATHKEGLVGGEMPPVS